MTEISTKFMSCIVLNLPNILTYRQFQSTPAAAINQPAINVTSFDALALCRYYIEYDPGIVTIDEMLQGVEEHVDEQDIARKYSIPVDQNITVKVVSIDSKIQPTPLFHNFDY